MIKTHKYIYALLLMDNLGTIFYIGQSYDLQKRLYGHKTDNPYLKILPQWLKDKIKILEIECVPAKIAYRRERFWVNYFEYKGYKLVNKNLLFRHLPKGIKYKVLSNLECSFIAAEGYSKLSRELDINPETLRVANIKKRIKYSYFEKIFLGDKSLKYSQFCQSNNFMIK